MSTRLARVRAALWRGALFVLLWWALTNGGPGSWGLGAVSVVLATWASLVLAPPVTTCVSRIGLVRFLIFFLTQSLRGGVQVAAFALRPPARVFPPASMRLRCACRRDSAACCSPAPSACCRAR